MEGNYFYILVVSSLIALVFSQSIGETEEPKQMGVLRRFQGCLYNLTTSAFILEGPRCLLLTDCFNGLFNGSDEYLDSGVKFSVKSDIQKTLQNFSTYCPAVFAKAGPPLNCQVGHITSCMDSSLFDCNRLKDLIRCLSPYGINCSERTFALVLRRIVLGMFQTLNCSTSTSTRFQWDNRMYEKLMHYRNSKYTTYLPTTTVKSANYRMGGEIASTTVEPKDSDIEASGFEKNVFDFDRDFENDTIIEHDSMDDEPSGKSKSLMQLNILNGRGMNGSTSGNETDVDTEVNGRDSDDECNTTASDRPMHNATEFGRIGLFGSIKNFNKMSGRDMEAENRVNITESSREELIDKLANTLDKLARRTDQNVNGDSVGHNSSYYSGKMTLNVDNETMEFRNFVQTLNKTEEFGSTNSTGRNLLFYNESLTTAADRFNLPLPTNESDLNTVGRGRIMNVEDLNTTSPMVDGRQSDSSTVFEVENVTIVPTDHSHGSKQNFPSNLFFYISLSLVSCIFAIHV